MLIDRINKRTCIVQILYAILKCFFSLNSTAILVSGRRVALMMSLAQLTAGLYVGLRLNASERSVLKAKLSTHACVTVISELAICKEYDRSPISPLREISIY